MIKANNLGPDALFLLFCPPLISVTRSAESNVTGQDREECCVNPAPTPDCTQQTESYRESVQGSGGIGRGGRQVLGESEEGGK